MITRARILMCGREADVSNFVRQKPRYSEYVSKTDRNGKNRLSVRFCILDQAAELPDPRKDGFFPRKPLQFQFVWHIIEQEMCLVVQWKGMVITMKLKRMMICFLCLCLLCGCGAGTQMDEEKEPTVAEALAEHNAAIVTSDKAVPLDEARAELDRLSLPDYPNLTFRDGISVEMPEKLSLYELIGVGDFDLKWGDALQHYWVPDEAWNDKYYISDDGKYAWGQRYEGISSDGQNWKANIWCTGTVLYSVGEAENQFLISVGQPMAHTTTAILEEYDVLCGIPDGEVKLRDGSISYADAVDMAQSFADDWLAQTDLQTGLTVKYLRVCEDENGVPFIHIMYRKTFDGVQIADVEDNYHSLDESWATSPFNTGYMEFSAEDAIINSVSGVGMFGAGAGSLVPYDEARELSKIVPLSTACEILSEELAEYTVYNVQGVELEYHLYRLGNDQPEETYRVGVSDRQASIAKYVSWDVFTTDLKWTFYVNTVYGEELIFMVDCVTGEVTLIDNHWPD